MATPEQINAGAFIQTSEVLDMQLLYSLNTNSREFREVIIRMRQVINNISLLLNVKDTGYYPRSEFVTGQLFFPNPLLNPSSTSQIAAYRQTYRIAINFGSLPNTATKSVAHGLGPTVKWTFTRIYGAASDTTGLQYIPLPYASPTLANNISLDVDATNVNITTGSDRTNFDTCYVILEYMKN